LYVGHISRLILFVTDDEERVLGSLTDGDIRRSLLVDADLNKRTEEICNRNFVFEYESRGFLDLKVHRRNNIKILPILDQKKKMLHIIDLEKTRSLLAMECMIMAGGRGKRLSPLTDTIPKPMLPLNGKPI